jgi:hypothetical protein
MMPWSDPAKRDALWQRYWSIKDGHRPGLYERSSGIWR